ncbi:MAG: hypothetical protein ACREUZ_09130 [Burkholderiales bacterium]
MSKSLRVLLSIGVVVFAAACASRGGVATREGAVLVVDNRAFSDMTIYAVEGTTRRRLGFAPGNTRTEIQLPATLVNRDLQLLADPVGSSRTSVSNRIYVQAGGSVTLTIPP